MLYFLTVNYYSQELIKKLVSSINFHIRAKHEIVIINNSPKEQLSEESFSEFKNIKILTASKNNGFGDGCNLGIKYIYSINTNSLVWLINPDTTVDNYADTYILECFKNNPNLAILGTKIRDTQGNIWFSKGLFNSFLGNIKHEAKLSDTNNLPNGIAYARWVSGCSMVINLAKFAQCPNFNTRYFLYHEDVDFCEKYYRQGYLIAITNHILVTHAVSAIIGKNKKNMFMYYTFSRLVFLELYSHKISFLLYLAYVLFFKIPILSVYDYPNAIGRWRGIQKYFFNDRQDYN
jgi:GT2 family glycosyltransferase